MKPGVLNVPVMRKPATLALPVVALVGCNELTNELAFRAGIVSDGSSKNDPECIAGLLRGLQCKESAVAGPPSGSSTYSGTALS
jgi:hypothetical protein